MMLHDMSRCGHRGGKKQAAKFQYLIEGEYVTSQEIANRLGVKLERARTLLARARKRPAPLTWEALRSA